MSILTREKPWSFGIDVSEAKSINEVLSLANLNYSVKKNDIYDANGNVIPGYKSTINTNSNEVFGIVTDKYQVVQNHDAFNFTDDLISEGLTFETAGQHKSRVWVQAKMPSTSILGETYDQYICFTNSHDGSGSVKLFFTPLRIYCSNVINLSLRQASRFWAFKHALGVKERLHSAETTLLNLNTYMNELENTAESLATKKVSIFELDKILNDMFPVESTMTERQKNNIEQFKTDFYDCLKMEDVTNFKDTAYGAIMAATDLIDHRMPLRNTANFEANRWNNILDGSKFVDEFSSRLIAA